ncbi:MAG: acetylglutamate kinase [Oscillospiraceae bacterium]|jgi:acetylglutamate kinase|nr:acetylglutamate kinase [Oscillospiraceae bacterium]
MSIPTETRAQMLIKALPYIQKYHGKILVIKYGGNAMLSDELKHAVMGDLTLLAQIGVRVVLVHGGGPEITELMEKTGKKPVFADGLRVTDKETADIVQMALAGKVNKDLVNRIHCCGGKAIGLCGIDGHMILAKPRDEKLGFVGEITDVNPQPILDVLTAGYIPVVSTVGCDEDGNVYNINADTAAEHIAGALGAQSLIMMTDTVGILREPDDLASLVSELTVSQAIQFIREGVITGGMIPKTYCCVNAIRRGVERVFIIDGRTPHAILIEVLTDEGIGTMFR